MTEDRHQDIDPLPTYRQPTYLSPRASARKRTPSYGRHYSQPPTLIPHKLFTHQNTQTRQPYTTLGFSLWEGLLLTYPGRMGGIEWKEGRTLQHRASGGFTGFRHHSPASRTLALLCGGTTIYSYPYAPYLLSYPSYDLDLLALPRQLNSLIASVLTATYLLLSGPDQPTSPFTFLLPHQTQSFDALPNHLLEARSEVRILFAPGFTHI